MKLEPRLRNLAFYQQRTESKKSIKSQHGTWEFSSISEAKQILLYGWESWTYY